MKSNTRKSDCPIHYAMGIFGDRWTFLIIRDLMFKGRHYYGEMLNAEERIASNILADRLLKLERNGILVKSNDPDHKSKFIYCLTKKGIDLLPIMVELILWSAKYDQNSAVEKKFIREVKNDKEALIQGIRKSLMDGIS